MRLRSRHQNRIQIHDALGLNSRSTEAVSYGDFDKSTVTTFEQIAPWLNLSAAIVAQALMDYGEDCAMMYLANKYPYWGDAINRFTIECQEIFCSDRESIIRFVGSTWFQTLTDMTANTFYGKANEYMHQKLTRYEAQFQKQYTQYLKDPDAYWAKRKSLKGHNKKGLGR